MSSTSPVVLITGANTGLGLEIVRALAKSTTTYTILVGSRTAAKGEDAVKTVKSENPATTSTFHVVPIDVESDDSIAALASDVISRFGRVDTLVNNAGGNWEGESDAGRLTWRQAWTKTWDVNVSGAMVMTEAFVPLLLKSKAPRLLFIASGTSSIHETTLHNNQALQRLNASPAAGWPKTGGSNPTTIYRTCKAGMNMAMRQWVRILKEDNVKVFAVSPGFLATGLGGVGLEKLKAMGALDPAIGGNFVKDVIEGKRDEDAGKVIRKDSIQDW